MTVTMKVVPPAQNFLVVVGRWGLDLLTRGVGESMRLRIDGSSV